jgi:predicted RNA-binding protein YlqC (UPF0109 family)
VSDSPAQAVDDDVTDEDDVDEPEVTDDDDVTDADVVTDDDADDDDDDDDGADDDDDANQLPGATATDVLEYLVKALVDDENAVEIAVDDDGRGLRMQVRVGPGDMGRVIGRRGRIANAIRTVVRAAAAPDGVAVDVDFVD